MEAGQHQATSFEPRASINQNSEYTQLLHRASWENINKSSSNQTKSILHQRENFVTRTFLFPDSTDPTSPSNISLLPLTATETWNGVVSWCDAEKLLT
mmetsp:Transcript_15530/g.29490  ORF Transcript_15530/g.29490 Transcript_15530/m.29490 type:complete len:98 (+) Transcript_15530:48-341(+)